MMLATLTQDYANPSVKRKASDIFPFLEAYIAKKEQQIADIEQVAARYETKRLKEEQAYQSMSPLRRMLAGKKPDHHLAVEYIHYVKKPMEHARLLRQELEAARAILNQSAPSDFVSVTNAMAKELPKT